MTVQINGLAASNQDFTSSTCFERDYVIIPTMSQWGLFIFGLLLLNLGVFKKVCQNQKTIFEMIDCQCLVNLNLNLSLTLDT